MSFPKEFLWVVLLPQISSKVPGTLMEKEKTYRINYLNEHIKAMQEAIDDGVDLMGYTMWRHRSGFCLNRGGNEKTLWFCLRGQG